MTKKAFIFGSNYEGTSNQLTSCVSDCQNVASKLSSKGYTLTEQWSNYPLNWTTVSASLQSFLQGLRSGDNAIIYWSGHGIELSDVDGDEPSGLDATLYISSTTYVRDDIIRGYLQQAAAGVKILCIFDCCHSGTMADLTYRLSDLSIVQENSNTFNADIITFGGSPDSGLSYEMNGSGVLTSNFLWMLDEWSLTLAPSTPWIDFYLRLASKILDVTGELQYAQLTFTSFAALENSFWV